MPGRQSPSVYAVAAAETADVVAAVNFARQHQSATGRERRRAQLPGHFVFGGLAVDLDARDEQDIVLHEAFVAARLRRDTSAAAGGDRRSRRYLDARLRCSDDPARDATFKAEAARRSASRGSFKAAASAASPRIMVWPLRVCWRPKSSPPTALCGIANACTNPDLFWATQRRWRRQPWAWLPDSR